MRHTETLVARLAGKLVLDILPATAASLIGGLLLTHYGLGRVAQPTVQVASASAEMMELLRDEHGLIVSFLNDRLERERTKLAAEDTVRQGNGGDAPAPTNNPVQRAVASATKLPASHSRTVIAAPVIPSAPLIIAQVQPAESTSADAHGSQLLIASTTGLKDHVVSVTHRVVSVLGGIPSWIGDHLVGTDAKSRAATEMFAAS